MNSGTIPTFGGRSPTDPAESNLLDELNRAREESLTITRNDGSFRSFTPREGDHVDIVPLEPLNIDSEESAPAVSVDGGDHITVTEADGVYTVDHDNPAADANTDTIITGFAEASGVLSLKHKPLTTDAFGHRTGLGNEQTINVSLPVDPDTTGIETVKDDDGDTATREDGGTVQFTGDSTAGRVPVQTDVDNNGGGNNDIVLKMWVGEDDLPSGGGTGKLNHFVKLIKIENSTAGTDVTGSPDFRGRQVWYSSAVGDSTDFDTGDVADDGTPSTFAYGTNDTTGTDLTLAAINHGGSSIALKLDLTDGLLYVTSSANPTTAAFIHIYMAYTDAWNTGSPDQTI